MKQTSTILTDKNGYLLEDRQRFSESLLWDLQRRYYAEAGAAAWRNGDVPQYVTSNPRIADVYAETVFAFRRDLERRATDQTLGPLTLCDLGAGSGRFAFHFLARLSALCDDAGLDTAGSFRYVLSDFAQSNLDAWRAHPYFMPHFESGLLDVALFDVTGSDALALQVSGATIAAGDLDRPLIVIANYLFDSIPQELLYIDAGRIQECRISLASEADPDTLSAADLLAGLEYRCDRADLADGLFPEPEFTRLLEEYRAALTDTYLLFPVESLRCLRRLAALSPAGLLLLTGDKGDHRLPDLQGRPPPGLVRHGSFSFTVNYHALASLCAAGGGRALFSDAPAGSVNVGCLLWLPDAGAFRETHSAFRRFVGEFSPDDFYAVVRHARRHIDGMTVREILAFLRLSLYDSHQFARYLPRLTELASGLDSDERRAVTDAATRAWSLYFPLGEDTDLAYGIASLLYALDDYTAAISYFERSITLYGPHTGALYNMAACYGLLGRADDAAALLRLVLDADPDNAPARALLARHTAGAGTSAGQSSA